MSRPYTPGGRFDTDFETGEIHDAITKDLVNPVGSSVFWYVWNPTATHVDPIYDVGANDGVGRQWHDPIKVPVIRAVLQQGATNLVQQGFYNADRIHFTIDYNTLTALVPMMVDKLNPLNKQNPDPLNRDRIVWKNEVYRPLQSNLNGIISENFTLLTFECQQIMAEEMVNDPQFQLYAD
jgi:hypothetical protein